MLPFGGFLGTNNWEETLWQTQKPLEGLYVSSGPGTPRDLPGGARKHCWGDGCLGYRTYSSLLTPQPDPR